MQMGKIMRKSFIPTHAPFALDCGWTCNGYAPGLKNDDCDCASACFLIWVAGVYRRRKLLTAYCYRRNGSLKLLAKKWEGISILTKSEKFYFNYLKNRKEKFNKCFREKLKKAQLKEKSTS